MAGVIRHIGVLTSGGDAQGMNASIRAVVRMAIYNGLKVSGIMRGYSGMIEDDIEPMDLRSVAHIISLGGTILKSSRSETFLTKEGREKAHANLTKREIDGLIIIGGDGSMRGARIFQEEYNIPVIGIPGTIDNDIYGTDFTIGFDTAINVAMECVDKIRDTASSHDRLFFVEVMGRDTGHIALRTAVACGAIAVLMPEDPISLTELSERLKQLRQSKKTSSIVIVAEGNPNGDAYEVAQRMKEMHTGYETRVTVLGHIQRGGSPTASDRILAAQLGAFTVESLNQGKRGVMVGIINQALTLTPIEDAVNQKTGFNEELYRMATILSR